MIYPYAGNNNEGFLFTSYSESFGHVELYFERYYDSTTNYYYFDVHDSNIYGCLYICKFSSVTSKSRYQL